MEPGKEAKSLMSVTATGKSALPYGQSPASRSALPYRPYRLVLTSLRVVGQGDREFLSQRLAGAKKIVKSLFGYSSKFCFGDELLPNYSQLSHHTPPPIQNE